MKLMGPTENLLVNIACCLGKGESNPRTSLNLLPAFQRPPLQPGRKFPPPVVECWSKPGESYCPIPAGKPDCAARLSQAAGGLGP